MGHFLHDPKIAILHIFAFLTPKMDSLTLKIWGKCPNNIEIGPNFTYPVSRGLVTGLAAPFLNTFLHHKPVPQVLKKVVNLSCLTLRDRACRHSSMVSMAACYRGCPRFKSRQGPEFINF